MDFGEYTGTLPAHPEDADVMAAIALAEGEGEEGDADVMTAQTPGARAAALIRKSAVDVHAYANLALLGLGCQAEPLIPYVTRLLYCARPAF